MIFSQADFDDHEMVVAISDPRARLRGFIAVHSTALGPAFGGCRMWPYVDSDAAARDALRLSKGMSYKNAMADLAYGGGKAVIMGDARSDKTPALFRAFGHALNRLGGSYITAEDVGVDVDDMRRVAEVTPFVGGIPKDDGYRGGDPSPLTARGVFVGLKAAARATFGSDDLAGKVVAVQGVGHVGYNLCQLLSEAGAQLVVTDVAAMNVRRAVQEFGAKAADPEDFTSVAADILAPCALGGVLNRQTIPAIKARLVAGAANNQLATESDGERLQARGIVYAPDYVINAGGIISVTAERDPSQTRETVLAQVDAIGPRLDQIFDHAHQSGRPPHEVADEMAREKIRAAAARRQEISVP